MTFTVRELEALAIEIVDLPCEKGDFPLVSAYITNWFKSAIRGKTHCFNGRGHVQ